MTKHAIEDLSNQISDLQKCLDSNSRLYTDITEATLDIYVNQPENEITNLCKLQKILNNAQNLDLFNRIKKRRLIEEINVNILTLIQQSIAKTYRLPIPEAIEDNKHRSPFKSGLFFLLGFLGTFYAAVTGASIVQTILGSLPNLVLIPVQIAFAAIAVLTFVALELNAIGKPLGIRAFDLGRVFKLYTTQSNLYEKSLSMLQTVAIEKNLNPKQLQELEQTFHQIRGSYHDFYHKVEQARTAQNKYSTIKRVLTTASTGIAALVCGTLGAFMAQGFAASTLPLIIGVAAATGPVGLGITFGIMAVCFVTAAILYVGLERKAMTEFVNKAWGTPTKAMKKLTENNDLVETCNSRITHTIETKKELHDLQQKNNSRRNLLTKTPSRSSYSTTSMSGEAKNFEKWQLQKGDRKQAPLSTNVSRLTLTPHKIINLDEPRVGNKLDDQTTYLLHLPVSYYDNKESKYVK